MKDAALLLIGHGSARHPDGAAPVLALAEAIQRQGLFRDVRAVFMKQAPELEPVERLTTAPEVYVVPVFAGKGYYTDQLIPEALALDGSLTLRQGQRIHYTAAAGTHPAIPGIMACRAEGVARGCGMEPSRTGLLLIAHGSARPGGAGETPRAIAAAIDGMERFAQVELVFLEQDPRAEDWAERMAVPDVVALPLLVAQGMHASRDIPPLFGLRAGETGPVLAKGFRVVLATGLGAEPDLVEVILDLVRASSSP